VILDTQGAFLRKLAYRGARFGPTPWVRYSPPLFGVAFALALPDARRAVLANLRRVFGPRSAVVEQLDVFRTFASYASCLGEALAAERPEAQRVRPVLRGGTHLSEALATSRGAVIATAHTGPWDAAARLLARDHDLNVMVLMTRERDRRAREIHDAVRLSSGVRILHVGGHALDALPAYRHLRNGGVVAAQIDRVPPGSRSVSVPLFGVPFRMPLGPFVLAARAGVPIVPMFAWRRGYFDYEVWIGHKLELPRRPTPADVQAAARRVAAPLERFVRAHPTQWFQFGN
jgi:KDO2-lipid IV(A) lauroyltransferase